MIIELSRTYYPTWTHGVITINEIIVSQSIELPWKKNARNVSCIPEGIYPIVKRRSKKYGDHIWVKEVPNRDWILLHPANDAQRELRGCIAPVMQSDGNGKGSFSRIALQQIMVNMSISQFQGCYLKIQERLF